MSANLKTVGKAVVSRMIEQARSSFPWKVLVADDYALKILSAATKLFDLTEEKISVIEKLSLKRKPMREMDAMYVAAPTEESINLIIEDFEPSKRLYNACHLFFTSEVDPELFRKISSSPIAKFIKTFKEANYEYLVVESQVFCTDILLGNVYSSSSSPSPSPSFAKIFSPAHAKTRRAEMTRVARQIASLCASVGEYPFVRYGLSSMATNEGPLARIMASCVQEQVDNLYRMDEAQTNETNRATLLVLDRSFDLIAPLLHEFTYQAMVQDLLEIDGNKYSYQASDATGKTVSKTAVLDEEDEKWREYRHSHIADCVTKIVEEFNAFIKQNESLRDVGKGDAQSKSLKDVGALIRAAPHFTEQLSKYSLHLSLTQSAMGKFSNDKLDDLARLEQCLATKETAEGEPYKGPTLDEMLSAIQGRSDYDKARLLMLYILFKEGISKDERASLISKFGLGESAKEAVEHLTLLGIKPDFPAKADPKKAKGKKDSSDDSYELSRYVPKLKKILLKLAEGELSNDEYPFIKEIPPEEDEDGRKRGISMRTTKTTWAKGSKKDEGSSLAKGPKIIVFILGGATFSEMRSVYEITTNDVILGSNNICRPNEFVAQLRTLSAK